MAGELSGSLTEWLLGFNIINTIAVGWLTRVYAIGKKNQKVDDDTAGNSRRLDILCDEFDKFRANDFEGHRKWCELKFDTEHKLVRDYMNRNDEVTTTLREKQAGLVSEVNGLTAWTRNKPR